MHRRVSVGDMEIDFESIKEGCTVGFYWLLQAHSDVYPRNGVWAIDCGILETNNNV